MAASAWTPVKEPNAPAGWTPVEETPRSAASPIAPPAVQRPNVPMHPAFLAGDPNKDATPPSFGEVAEGMARNLYQVSTPGIATSVLNKNAPSVAQHLPAAMRDNATPIAQLPMQVAENFTMMAAPETEGAGVEAPKPGVPKIAPKISPPSPEGPGMMARVGSLVSREAKSHIPFFGRSVSKPTFGDVADAVRGPEAPTPTPPKPAIAKIPETEGIQWGTGGKGPIDLRGQRIPVKPVYPGAHLPEKPPTNPGAPFPEKPPAEVFKARGLETGGQSPQQPPESALGKIAVVPEKAPRPITYPPEAPRVIERPKTVAPERARFLEDKSTQEEIRDAAEREDQSRLSQEKREWFARNQPGQTKGELVEQASKAVKAPMAKVTSSGPRGVGVTTPETDDLVPVLKKSLEEARKRRGASR